jgi:hypothetical protein
MKRLIVSLLLSLAFFSYGQVRFKYLIELGVNGSSWPKKDPLPPHPYAKSREAKNRMTLGPVIGIYFMPSLSSKFGLSVGTQLFRQSTKYVRDEYWHDWFYQVDFKAIERNITTLTTIAIPIQIKYHFNTGKLKANAYLGFRILNFLDGSYYYLRKTTYEQDIGHDSFEERSFSPFSDELVVKANRQSLQFNAGLGVQVAKRFEIYATIYTPINGVYFEEKLPPNVPPDYGGIYHMFDPFDLSLSVRYTLN